MKYLKKVITALLFSLSYFLNAQDVSKDKDVLPVIFSASPNAAALGSYAQIPVNLFNGQPNININLHTVKLDNYQLPISLSYNLNSIKPEERPGWVGLGWNLNAGGAITRIVKGGVDECVIDAQAFENSKVFSYYNNFSRLAPADWASQSKMAAYTNMLRSGFLTTANFTTDSEHPSPDEFMFNVNGLSGSFFLNHEGKWIVKSNQSIDIKINEELKTDFRLYEVGDHPTHNQIYTPKSMFYGFTLTTDDGTQYVFGKAPNAIEFSAAPRLGVYSQSYSNLVAKTWYITKIILPSSKIISFEYTTNTEPESAILGKGDVYNKTVYKRFIVSNYMRYWTNGVVNQRSSTSSIYNEIIERSFVVYLKKITTDDTEIVFNNSASNDLDYPFVRPTTDWQKPYNSEYSHGLQDYFNRLHWFKLDDFIVNDKINGKQVAKTAFKYLENTSSRLFLTSIEESGIKNAPAVKKHIFSYNNSISLPPYNAQKNDHWGYFNNINFVESYPLGTAIMYTPEQLRNNYHATRNPNPAVIQAGTLNKITYPTGGFSTFYYEPHDFSKVVDRTQTAFTVVSAASANEQGGGLRIKKIETDPQNSGIVLSKEYFYDNDYANNDLSSSGILSGRAQYIEESANPTMQYFQLSSNSFNQLNDTNGSPVTYTKVVEKSQDGSFTEYTYSNHDNGFGDKPANGYYFKFMDYNGNVLPDPPSNIVNAVSKKISFNSRESERGNLLFEKKRNSLKQLVEENTYTYNDDASRFSDKIRIIDFTQTQIGETTGVQQTGIITFTGQIRLFTKMAAYSVYTHPVYLKKKVNTLYDLKNSSNVTTTTDYIYSNSDNHHHLKTEVTKSSENDTEEKKYFYAPDSEMAAEPFRNELLNKNMTGIPLNVKTFSSVAPAAGVKTSEQLTKYASFPSQITGQTIFLPKEIYINKGIASIVAGDRKVTFDAYDNKGNVLQYTPEKGAPVSVIWGYNNTLPVAKLENVMYSSISATSIAAIQKASNGGSEAAMLTALGNLRTSLPVISMATTYTYNPLVGITSVTDPKGSAIFYKYDDFNRLSFIRDQKLNVLERYCYNYKGQLTDCTNTIYFSVLKQGVFNGNCGSGTVAAVTYRVEPGSYTSTISQADADSKAQLDLTENGQKFADKNVSCVYSNDVVTGNFVRNNCGIGTEGTTYIAYTVPAGAYTSTISKQEAQDKAQADFNLNGQNYANANGFCSPVRFNATCVKELLLNKIFLEAYASSANHNGNTLHVEINYFNENGDFVKTETADLTLLAGETYKKFTIPAPTFTTAELNY